MSPSGSTLRLSLAIFLAFFATEAAACASGARCIKVGEETAPQGDAQTAPGEEQAKESYTCAGGARCIRVAQRQSPRPQRTSFQVIPAPFAVGDVLAPGSFSVVTGSDRLGFEAPRDGWVYVLIQDWVLRMELASRVVLEDVTDQMPVWYHQDRW